MNISCDYHPTEPARWNCPSCNTAYCGQCVTTRIVDRYGKKESFHFCPKCNIQADRIAASNGAMPFWNRLPRFFAFPFHIQPLILMTALAIVTVLFSGPGLFKALIRFAAWGVLLKYAFAVLKDTANGKFIPPKLNTQTLSNDFQVVFKQLGIYIIIGIVFALILKTAGPLLGIPFLFLSILSIPSMVIVLVATNSLIHALNPLIFFRMAWRIGWGYLLMYLFLMLLGGAPAVLARYIISFLPSETHVFLFTFAKSFYTIISYHLMGYVLFQYHDEIGYEVDLDDASDSDPNLSMETDATQQLLNRADIFIKEGKIDEAISLIKEESGGVFAHLALAEKYYNLLKIKNAIPDLLSHAKVYMELLLKENQKEKLCNVYSECHSQDADFSPAPSVLFKTAGFLNETNNPKKAIEAYNLFVKANPTHPLIPKAYFLAAGIIQDKLKNPRKAIGILKGIIKKYPEHDIVPYVQKCLGETVR